jgi:DNA-binding transcriptional LysR family regulator
MNWDIRELRALMAVVEAGSITDAAIALKVSQATVSRTIQHLEKRVGGPLLRRHRGGSEPTALCNQLVPAVRRLLADLTHLDELVGSAHATFRVGYAWSAVGVHTTALLRGWSLSHPETDLQLIRHDSPTGGLAEGLCDVAILRTAVDTTRFNHVVVGREPRVAAFAADDPRWARRRAVTMDEIATRPVVIEPRTGTTTENLWAGGTAPSEFVLAHNLDEWLDLIAAGRGVSTTSSATSAHHQRVGVAYKPISDGPPIAVHLAWWRHSPEPIGLGSLIQMLSALYG